MVDGHIFIVYKISLVKLLLTHDVQKQKLN